MKYTLKSSIILMAALLLTFAQGVWAQTVTTAGELTDAVGTDNASIVLGEDIQLASYLNINGKTVTIDLNGHKLSRNITGGHASNGHVIYVHNRASLTLANSTGTGRIEGGKALNGGAVFIEPGSTVSANGVTFQNNSAGEHAGAIWNGGTLAATNCTFKNNTANDVGAVYNSVVQSSCGTATFTGCTFTENTSNISGGALANAEGGTSMTVTDCIMTGNTANTNGSAIWNGGTLTVTGGSITGNACGNADKGGAIYQLYGTLNMSGNPVVSGNTKGGVASNVYLASGKKITVTGPFTTGARIGLSAAYMGAALTSGFTANNPRAAAGDFFFADDASFGLTLGRNEVTGTFTVTYRDLNGNVAQQSGCSSLNLYTDGGTLPSGWYVVDSNISVSARLRVSGTVNLILCDGKTLSAPKGVTVSKNNVFTIWGQHAGTGRLDATDPGGISAIGGNSSNAESGNITINGGVITARCKGQAAAIGGASGGDGHVTINGGTVTASVEQGDLSGGAGIGSGYGGSGYVTINGGTVTARGYHFRGAGIGGGGASGGYDVGNLGDCTVTITGGTVTAEGGRSAAGIGGGDAQKGTVTITGGTVTATGGYSAAGLGGGLYSTGRVSITGGTVVATGGEDGCGIGHGKMDRIWYDGTVVTLGYTGYVSIRANSYGGSVTLQKKFFDPDGQHYGPVDPLRNNDVIAGKTLIPATISLVDDQDNSQALTALNGKTPSRLPVLGRTLWKDGSWNTICLPFALSSIAGTPLAGATVKALTGASFSDGVLTLTFGEAVTAIEAGKPYIVKWDAGTNITNLEFGNVCVNKTTANTTVGGVTFTGTYSPVVLPANDKTKLYLGADNKLYYATSDLSVNSFRGYFVLSGSVQPNAVRSLVMDFGEEPAGEVTDVEE